MNRRQKIIVSVTGIFIVLLILIGLTYAYFLTRITGNGNPNSISVTTANLELVYGDGTTAILTSSNPIEPGKFRSSKDFTVTNNGNALTDYAVTLEDFSITYANDTVIDGVSVKAGTVTKMEYPDDMKMEITCVIESDDEDRNGQVCGNVDSTLPTENSILLTNSIEVDDVHKYVLTLTYEETGIDQSKDMNKTIKGKIDIIDPKSTIDLSGTVATYQTGDYVEINSTPIKSEIIDGKYKIIGVEPGNHTLYVKYKDANGDIQTRGSQTLTIKKGEEASVSGTTITFTDASRSATVDVNSDYTIRIDEKIKEMEKKEVPTLAARQTYLNGLWTEEEKEYYESQMDWPESYITSVTFVDEASDELIASASRSVPAAVDADGDGENDSDIMCYLMDYEGTDDTDFSLVIAGNGSGEIMANQDSSEMFYEFSSCKSINNINLLNTSNVTNMNYMFAYNNDLKNLDLSNFNTENVDDMGGMFVVCNSLTSLDLSDFDTSKVKNMGEMFAHLTMNMLDLSNFDTSNVTDMGGMFNYSEIETIYVSDKFVTTNVTYSVEMFNECYDIVGGNNTKYDKNHIDAEYARIDTAETPGYFTAK